MMLHAAVGSIAGLYQATRSVPVTLVGFGQPGYVTGWYLWVRRGSDDDVSPEIPSDDKVNERRFRASEEQRLILSHRPACDFGDTDSDLTTTEGIRACGKSLRNVSRVAPSMSPPRSSAAVWWAA